MICSLSGTLLPERWMFKRKRTKNPKLTSHNIRILFPAATQELRWTQHWRISLCRASLNPCEDLRLCPLACDRWCGYSIAQKKGRNTTSRSAKHPKSLTLQKKNPHLHAGQFFGRAEAVDRVGSAGLELDEQQQEEATGKWAFSVHGVGFVGNREVQAVSSEMSLQVSLFLVLSSLFQSLSFILFGCDLCFLGYQWIYLGHIPVPLQACSSVKGRFPLLAVIRQQLLLLRNVCHKSVISCHSPSSWYQALWLHSPVGNS